MPCQLKNFLRVFIFFSAVKKDVENLYPNNSFCDDSIDKLKAYLFRI